MTLPMIATRPPTYRRRMERASSTTRMEGFSSRFSGTSTGEKSACGASRLSGIRFRSPQSTSHPMAAASWWTLNSGITVSNPRISCPARASSAMAWASRCASGKETPASSIRPWQTTDVGFPAGGRAPFRPLNTADMTRL